MPFQEIRLKDEFDQFISENEDEKDVMILFYPSEGKGENILTKVEERAEHEWYKGTIAIAQVNLSNSLDWAQDYIEDPEAFNVLIKIHKGEEYKVKVGINFDLSPKIPDSNLFSNATLIT